MRYKLDNNKHFTKVDTSAVVGYIVFKVEGKVFNTLQPQLNKLVVLFTFSKEVLQLLKQYYENHLYKVKACLDINQLV